MPLPLLLLGAAIAAVGTTALAIAMSDDDDDSDCGDETASSLRKAEENERRREAAEQKRRRRATILKDAQDALTELARRHEALGRSPEPRLTQAKLEEALSEWRTETKAGIRKALHLLMPVNPVLGGGRSVQELRALNEQLDVLDGLNGAISKHAAGAESGQAATKLDVRIRRSARRIVTASGADDSCRSIVDAVDHYLGRAALDVHAPSRIVACGLLCAGKSSLLNALSGRHAPEYFVSGGGRTTRDCKTLHAEFAGYDCLLIDTPGLDAAGADSGVDDARTVAEVGSADHLLFVHPLALGELQAAEVDFLATLASDQSADGELPCLTVVLTHADSYQEDAERLTAAILSMVEATTGQTANAYQTSATDHAKGVLEGKSGLIEFSGIPALRRHIGEILSTRKTIVESRKKRMTMLAERVSIAVEAYAADLRCRRDLILSERREDERRFTQAFEEILDRTEKRLGVS